jgi:hypothetical protein
MRSYIFTPRERRIAEAFLDNEIPAADSRVSQLRTRVRRFTQLPKDIKLYRRIRETITT